MKIKTIKYLLLLLIIASCTSHPDVPAASSDAGTLPVIYPDYCNVTVPCNIAPLNFMHADDDYTDIVARITTPDGQQQTYGDGIKVIIPEDEWADMLKAAKGKSISVEVWGKKADKWYAFRKFSINVANEPVDEYISYRLIEPSYVLYDYMEIAQRNISTFDESQIYNNKVGCDDPKGQCINCHSYQNYKTDNMLFHVRVSRGGTIIVNNGKAKKVDLKRDNTISPGVYPSWHPTAKLVAFSTNTTRQNFHTDHIDKVEVFDNVSDIVLYDVDADDVSIISNDSTRLEVFPTWTPDGKYLYYCATLSIDSVRNAMTDNDRYRIRQYNLYRRSFDIKTRKFGNEELVFDAVAQNMSVTLPRVSPDGSKILFSIGQYGCFHIWHHDSNIGCLSLSDELPLTIEGNIVDIRLLNSRSYAESYPSWSSNGKWIMCASRRDDGNYSRVYISYFDGKKAHKAFLLPQKDPEHNTQRLKSYNRPEFMVEPVKQSVGDFRNVVVGN